MTPGTLGCKPRAGITLMEIHKDTAHLTPQEPVRNHGFIRPSQQRSVCSRNEARYARTFFWAHLPRSVKGTQRA